MVYETIGDVVEGLGLAGISTQEDGLTRAQRVAAFLAYAQLVTSYDEHQGGFVVKPGFEQDDPSVWDPSVYNSQVDAWDSAVDYATSGEGGIPQELAEADLAICGQWPVAV